MNELDFLEKILKKLSDVNEDWANCEWWLSSFYGWIKVSIESFLNQIFFLIFVREFWFDQEEYICRELSLKMRDLLWKMKHEKEDSLWRLFSYSCRIWSDFHRIQSFPYGNWFGNHVSASLFGLAINLRNTIEKNTLDVFNEGEYRTSFFKKKLKSLECDISIDEKTVCSKWKYTYASDSVVQKKVETYVKKNWIDMWIKQKLRKIVWSKFYDERKEFIDDLYEQRNRQHNLWYGKDWEFPHVRDGEFVLKAIDMTIDIWKKMYMK